MEHSSKTVTHHISSGAVVYHRNKRGAFECLVMHRSATNTWHLPKGTQRKGESLKETTVREVLEETGYHIQIGFYLGSLDSEFARDGIIIPKRTHYFLAMAEDVSPTKHDLEHDCAIFVPMHEAHRLLREHTWREEEWIPIEQAMALLRA